MRDRNGPRYEVCSIIGEAGAADILYDSEADPCIARPVLIPLIML